MRQMINQKRENFHMMQGKKLRDEILQSKRKFVLSRSAFDLNSKQVEPQYKQIHQELCNASLTREDFIQTLLDDDRLMNDIISSSQQSKDQDTPLLILHNLCWTQSSNSLKKIIAVYKLDRVFCELLMQKNQSLSLIDICLGGICNLLGLHIENLKQSIEYFIESQLLQFLIQFGEIIMEQNNTQMYATLLRSINFIFEFIKYFSLEKIVTSQQIFDIFRLSLHAFKMDQEQTIVNMFRIILISTDSLFNLIEFLDDDWIKDFIRYFGQWILLGEVNRVNLCLKLILQLFSRCQPIYILQFLHDGQLEQKLFDAANINREQTLKIMLVIINCEGEESKNLFQIRSMDILQIFSQCVNTREIKVASQLMYYLLEDYLSFIVIDLSSAQEIMFLIEDKYTQMQMYLNFLREMQQNKTQSSSMYIPNHGNLKFSLEKDFEYMENQDILDQIEQIFILM